jgi:hypothetical protein
VKGLPLIRKLFLITCHDAKLGTAARALRAVMLAASAVPIHNSNSADSTERY